MNTFKELVIDSPASPGVKESRNKIAKIQVKTVNELPIIPKLIPSHLLFNSFVLLVSNLGLNYCPKITYHTVEMNTKTHYFAQFYILVNL